MVHGDGSQPSNQKDLFGITTILSENVKVHDQLLICEGLSIVPPFPSFKKKKSQHYDCLIITPPEGCLISYTKMLGGAFVSVIFPETSKLEMKQTGKFSEPYPLIISCTEQ